MTTDIVKRLRASVGCGAIDGDAFERSVCEKQMIEAANVIEQLQSRPAAPDGYRLVPAESADITADRALRSLENTEENIRKDSHLRAIDRQYHLAEVEKERGHAMALKAAQQPDGDT